MVTRDREVPHTFCTGSPGTRRLRIIINPAAGQDEPLLKIFNRVLSEAGYDWDVAITREAGDATRLAQEAAAAGVEIVAAYGGDGTVMEVAHGLLGTGTLMAILPGGTANVIALELGIPTDAEAACRVMVAAPRCVRRVDVGQANDRYFLLRMGTGFEATVTVETDRELKDRWGILAYVISAMRVLRDPPIAHYRLSCDGELFEGEGYACIVANARSLGALGMGLAPTIDMSDGILDVFFLGETRLKALSALAANVIATAEAEESLLHWRVREVEINADPPQPLEGDGELFGETPVRVRVLERALGVIVPAERSVR